MVDLEQIAEITVTQKEKTRESKERKDLTEKLQL